jgi:hypothetical protein
MNILVHPHTGHITGVVDWADATIEPFGIALWGLDSVLGCSGSEGWPYFGSIPPIYTLDVITLDHKRYFGRHWSEKLNAQSRMDVAMQLMELEPFVLYSPRCVL